MADATDNVVNIPTTTTKVYQVDTVDTPIVDVDPFAGVSANTSRIPQQRLISQAVKTPALSQDLIQVIKAVPGYIILPTATSARFLFTIVNNSGNTLLAIPSVSFFVGGDKSNGEHWPGPNYGEGSMPTSVYNDDYWSDGADVVTQAVIRNNTGFNLPVYCYCNWRVIVNPGSGLTQTGAPSVPVGGRGGL